MSDEQNRVYFFLISSFSENSSEIILITRRNYFSLVFVNNALVGRAGSERFLYYFIYSSNISRALGFSRRTSNLIIESEFSQS